MYEEEEFNMADPKIVVYIDILSAFSYMVFYVVNVCKSTTSFESHVDSEFLVAFLYCEHVL
jgi:hypothetical protein